MAEFPALPVWTDAYLADCSHLSFEEHGIYFRLLMLMWRSPECRIPNEDEWIARRLSCSTADVYHKVRPIITEFCETNGNWLMQSRLIREWKWCRNKRKKNTDAAKSRWKKEIDVSERITSTGNANALPPHPSHTLPTPQEDKSSLRSDLDASLAKLPSKRERRVLTALPDDCPTQADRDAAIAFWRDHGREDLCARLAAEVEAFRDHHAGHGKRMADWSAAWRTWRGNAMRFNRGPSNGTRPSNHNGKGGNHAAHLEALADLAREEDGRSQSISRPGELALADHGDG